MLVFQHRYNILRPYLRAAHLQVEKDVLTALGKTAKQTDHYVFVLHLSADAADLNADAENFGAMVQDICAFRRHLYAEQPPLEADTTRILQAVVQSLQARPHNPRFLQSSIT